MAFFMVFGYSGDAYQSTHALEKALRCVRTFQQLTYCAIPLTREEMEAHVGQLAQDH